MRELFQPGPPMEPAPDAAAGPVLDVGCGRAKLPGATGIDIANIPGVDVVHDLDRLPWPLPSSTYGYVRLRSVLEHLGDVMGVLAEVHRVSLPGALVVIGVPHFSSANAYTDPTHRHYFSSRFLDYLIDGTELHQAFGFYTDIRFQLEARWVTLAPFWNRLGLARLVNRRLEAYETYLCNVVRGADIQLLLRVLK